MRLNKIHFALIFLCFTTFIFAQQNEAVKPLPVSIYSSNSDFIDLNSTYAINKKLNLTTFKFMYLNIRNIEEGYYTIPFYNINNAPSSYIYETYNKVYQTAQLQKSFFKVSDLYKPRTNNQL